MIHSIRSKNKLILYGAVYVFCVFSPYATADSGRNPAWVSALKPRGTQGREMVLADNEKTRYKILLPAKPTSVETKAAGDLAQWLQQMTAATFEIVNEPAHPSKFISLGNTEALAKSDPESLQKKMKLGRDGYVIDQQGENLFVWGGTPRGVMNGVYSLLEEDLDCRWYHRGAASIPKVSKLIFTPVIRSYAPRLEIRDPYYWDACDNDWALRNKTQRIPVEYGGDGGYPPGYDVHTYNKLVPREKYFQSHPEYFGMLRGKRSPVQLCLSNPDVLAISIQQVREVLRKYPHVDRIDVSPNDGRGYCECDACRAYNQKHGNTQSASLLRFVNRIAEAIETEFPNVKVTTLAYLDTIQPPRNLKPRKNVIIRICTDSHAWGHCLEPITATQKFQSLMKAWAKTGAKMYVWDYTINFRHYALPMPNMYVVGQNIRWLTAHNAKGILQQGDYQGPGAARAPLRCWVWARQLWNPKLDTKLLIHDFTYGYFGPAAEPMQAYYDLLWDMWIRNRDTTMKNVGGQKPDAPFFTPEFAAQATELFKKAEQSTEDPVILKRVRLEKFALLYLKLSRGSGFVQGDDYGKMLDEFGRIAKENNITMLWEAKRGDQVQEKITYWRNLEKSKNARLAVIPIGPECTFSPDPRNEGVAKKWFSVDCSDLEWSKIKCGLDGGWNQQGFKELTGVGWYRIRFAVPESLKQYKHVSLLVGAADEDAVLWLNGQKVFEHTCKSTGLAPMEIWNTPFIFPLGTNLRIGGENVLAVRIFNREAMGGLWKPLYLVGSSVDLTAEALLETIESK
ncbi:MAG: DUF4838 domain-containing protein [Phycisphaerae bacterium]|nr:DUF4838 domain-containing protein [Phycisphaerae bacterium]